MQKMYWTSNIQCNNSPVSRLVIPMPMQYANPQALVERLICKPTWLNILLEHGLFPSETLTTSAVQNGCLEG